MGQINIGGTKAVQLKGYTDSSITSDQAFTFPDTGGELATVPAGGQVVGYQQGVWIPAINQGSVDFNGPIWSRVGNMVTIESRVKNFTQTSGTKSIEVSNFPYQFDFTTAAGGTAGSVMSSNTEKICQCSYMNGVGDLNFYVAGLNAVWSSLRFQDVAVSTEIVFQITYRTDDTTWTPQNGATLS